MHNIRNSNALVNLTKGMKIINLIQPKKPKIKKIEKPEILKEVKGEQIFKPKIDIPVLKENKPLEKLAPQKQTTESKFNLYPRPRLAPAVSHPEVNRGVRSITERSPLSYHLRGNPAEPLSVPEIEKITDKHEPVKSNLEENKPFKNVSEKISKKQLLTNVNGRNYKQISSLEPKKAAENKNEPSSKNKNEDIKKASIIEKDKLVSPMGTFENKINDIDNNTPHLSFAPRGYDELTKTFNKTTGERVIKYTDTKIDRGVDTELPDVIRVYKRGNKSIVKESPLKQRVNYTSLNKSNIKEIKVASLIQDTKTHEESRAELIKEGNIKPVNIKTETKIEQSDTKYYTKVEKEFTTKTYMSMMENENYENISVYEPNISSGPQGSAQDIDRGLRNPTEDKIIKLSNANTNKEVEVKTPEIIRLNNKKEKSVVSNKSLINDNKYKNNFKEGNVKKIDAKENKTELKIKESSNVTEEQKIGTYDNLSSISVKSKEKTEKISKNIVSKEDSKILKNIINKDSDKVIKNSKQENAPEKKFDTSLSIYDEVISSAEKKEEIKDAKVIDNKDLHTLNKSNLVKTPKIKRMVDRNPVIASRSTPLTVVSRGGTVTPNIVGEVPAHSKSKDIKKETKKEEIKKQNVLFPINTDKSDIKKLVFKENNDIKTEEKMENKEKSKNVPTQSLVQENIDDKIKKEAISIEKRPLADIFEKKELPELKEKAVVNTTKKVGENKKSYDAAKDKKPEKTSKTIKETSIATDERRKEKGEFPNIEVVYHNATKVLELGDELEVTLEGDSGEFAASFDIGLYHTKIPMIEVSPGVYRGIYRVMKGDNISNANIIGNLMNSYGNQSFMIASNPVSLDTSPGITIVAPTSGIVDNPGQTVVGVVDDPQIKVVQLSVNGEITNDIPVDKNYFNFDVKLKEGENIIEVSASDIQGNTGKDRIELTYATYKSGPKVFITSPPDGEVINVLKSPVIEISGTVSDQSITQAKLIGNGFTMYIGVRNGEFYQKVTVLAEINSYVVEVIDKKGTMGMSEPITIKAFGLKNYDAIITLEWDISNADIDLVLKSPTGKSISRKARSFTIPGCKLELYTNKGSLGQEVVSLRQAAAGLYNIIIKNHGSFRTVNTSLSITFKDSKESSKVNAKQFGPKALKAGEEWEIYFVCLPEEQGGQ
ncbi:MAG: hypothetical protein HY934_04135 [Candidatus Firestonebacteria bacterium]|nr:hypothetical protein [Candidatus Firestonebacteria bacterium]